MRTKVIAAVLVGAALLGLQGFALAQDLNEHPPVATPSQAQQNPNAAAQYNDRQVAPPDSGDMTGRPAPGPHESGH